MVTIPLGVSDWRRTIGGAPYIRLRNRYFESNPANQVEQQALLTRPALERFLSAGNGPCRGLYSQPGSFNDALFVMSGRVLYKIGTDQSVTLIGGTFFEDGDDTTRASMAATAAIGTTSEKLFIADGKQLRVYEPDTFARGELFVPTGIANNDEVRVGGVYYRFTNGSVNAGTPAGTSAHPWLVAHVADTRTNLENLLAAINDSGTAGTTYSTALTANAAATAERTTADTLFVRANVIGTSGNSVVTTDTITGGGWLAGTLTGGTDDGLTIVDVPEGLAAISVAFIAGYIIVVPAPVEGFKGRFYWIEPGEKTILTQNFATAERSADPLVAVRSVGDQFALFGTNSTEMWYPTGDLIAPFARSQSRVFERGVWENTDVQIKDSLVIMDTDGVVYRIDGGGPQRISDHSVEERTRKAIKFSITQTGGGGGTVSPLAISCLNPGQSTSGLTSTSVFSANLATATGGVAPYSYRAFFNVPGAGTFGFVGANNTPLVTPQVVNVANSTTATATLFMEVTDAQGTITVTDGLTYSHQNTTPPGDPTPPPPVATLTVTASPSLQSSGAINDPNNTYAPITATVSGGVGPYTYQWYFEAASSGFWTVTSPTAATTTVQVDTVPPGELAQATVRCRVTDSTGAFGISNAVVFFHSNELFPAFGEGGFIP